MCNITAVPKTRRLVGRAAEERTLRQSIESAGELRVVHVEGSAGLGKTRLLNEIHTIIQSCQNATDCRYVGILDLYDPALHSNSGLEQAIVQALDPTETGFTTYRAGRDEYERQRRAGADAIALERLRPDLADRFVADFNALTRTCRPVVVLDTVELIQYESDDVQRMCAIGPVGIEVRQWVMTNLPRMRNAVFVLAGRRKPALLADLRAALGTHLQHLVLQPFNEAQTLEYLDAIAEALPPAHRARMEEMEDETRRVIYHYTGGEPLKLTVIVELLIRDLPLPEAFTDSMDRASHLTGRELEQVRERTNAELLRGIMESGAETDTILPCLAVARLGMTAELLCYLLRDAEKWPLQHCQEVLDGLQQWSFVKTHPHLPITFLHDEMYDLMDRHVLEPMGGEYLTRIAGSIGDYYETMITSGTGARETQLLRVEQLYYRLLANVQSGYFHYMRLATEAVFTHAVGFEMGLRDQMLRFFERRPRPDFQQRVNRDSAVLWVERYVAMGHFEQAVQVVQAVRDSTTKLQATDDAFFNAALLYARGRAMVMLGQNLEQAMTLLRQAVNLLDDVAARGEFETWNQACILGGAYDALGLAYAAKRQVRTAIPMYRNALPYLRQAELHARYADTEKNLAYMYGQMGSFDEAIVLIESSLEAFRSMGNRYGEAYALNTLGLIRTQEDHYYRAYLHCKEALGIFKELDSLRGTGLAYIALGRASRKRGVFELYTLDEAQPIFEEAVRYLDAALGIFPAQLAEHRRALEARNELGCVYRDWAMVYRRHKLDATGLEQRARGEFERCLQELPTGYSTDAADTHLDLAQMEFNRGPEGYAAAVDRIAQAEAYVDPAYRILEGQGVPRLDNPNPGYWIMLGQGHLLNGHVAFAEGRDLDACGGVQKADQAYARAIQHYVLSIVYFSAYSPKAPALRASPREMHDRLRRLSARRLRQLRDCATGVGMQYQVDVQRFLEMFDGVLGAVELIA